MALAFAFLPFLLLSPVVFAKNINVGDANGWTNGIDYSNWASSQTFNVGDKLMFTYGSSHSLDEVSKDGYENCNSGNPINSFSSSPTSITLTKAGPMYFTCPIHCSQGMKLAINVTPTSTTPGPGGSTPPSLPGSSTTPDNIPPSPLTPTGGATRIFGGFCPLMVVLVASFVFMA